MKKNQWELSLFSGELKINWLSAKRAYSIRRCSELTGFQRVQFSFHKLGGARKCFHQIFQTVPSFRGFFVGLPNVVRILSMKSDKRGSFGGITHSVCSCIYTDLSGEDEIFFFSIEMQELDNKTIAHLRELIVQPQI